jgi:hypothetical protein
MSKYVFPRYIVESPAPITATPRGKNVDRFDEARITPGGDGLEIVERAQQIAVDPPTSTPSTSDQRMVMPSESECPANHATR